MTIKVAHSHPLKLNLDLIPSLLHPQPHSKPMGTYFVPSTPPPRGRAYSFSQPSQYYPPTPYSAGNALSLPYTPGVSRSATYYVAPTVTGRRSRSHSRPRHGHTHHRSTHHHHGGHHGHSRRSHSVGAHRHHHNRPSVHVRVSIFFIKAYPLTRL